MSASAVSSMCVVVMEVWTSCSPTPGATLVADLPVGLPGGEPAHPLQADALAREHARVAGAGPGDDRATADEQVADEDAVAHRRLERVRHVERRARQDRVG